MKTTQKRILLAVTGLTPQIVTETLYALSQSQPAWVPDEIQVITTIEGAERIRLALFTEGGKGMLEALRQDYGLPPIHFDESCVHVVVDKQGQPLVDIRTPEDNSAVADFITTRVRTLTQDPNTALHVSLAGGRKTMGYYVGYALSLFGREQDNLSHVLVSEPFESSWEFFYPTPDSRVIQTRDGNLANCRDAQVTLAHIPFVRLRHGLDERLLRGAASFSEVVRAAQNAFAPPRLLINQQHRYVEAGGIRIELPPVELALYSLFARRAKAGQPPLPAPPKDGPDPEWKELFLKEYARLVPDPLDPDDPGRVYEALAEGMNGNYFSSHKSKLMHLLRASLGPAGAERYGIQATGPRSKRLYGLKLAPEQIQYVGENL